MTQPHLALHVCKPRCTPTSSNGRGNMSFTSKRTVLPPAAEGYIHGIPFRQGRQQENSSITKD